MQDLVQNREIQLNHQKMQCQFGAVSYLLSCTYVIYSYCYLSAIFAHSSDVLQFFWLFDLFDRYDLLYLLFFLIYKVHNFFLKQDTHLLTIITLFYALELGTIFILRKGVFGLFQSTHLPL